MDGEVDWVSVLGLEMKSSWEDNLGIIPFWGRIFFNLANYGPPNLELLFTIALSSPQRQRTKAKVSCLTTS